MLKFNVFFFYWLKIRGKAWAICCPSTCLLAGASQTKIVWLCLAVVNQTAVLKQ